VLRDGRNRRTAYQSHFLPAFVADFNRRFAHRPAIRVRPGAAAPGPYTIEIFATPVGALADGQLGGGDVLASALDDVTFVP
jgi:hypothetical protein